GLARGGGERLRRRGASAGSRALELRALLDEEGRAAFDEVAAYEGNFISRTDGERHARLRGIAHRAFTPRRIAAMEADIRRYVDELLAPELERQAADLMTVAYGLPLWVVCNLLGTPDEDRELIHEWSLAIGKTHGGGLRELLLRREQWQALVADPSLVPSAIEELLRFITPVQFAFRFAVEDVEIGGARVPAGMTVFPLTAAANRDPAVFPEPTRL